VVTAAALALVRTADPAARKGDSIAAPDFRRLVANYVSKAGLVDLVRRVGPGAR